MVWISGDWFDVSCVLGYQIMPLKAGRQVMDSTCAITRHKSRKGVGSVGSRVD